MGVGGGLVNLSKTAGGEDHRLRMEDVNVSGGQFIRHNTGSDAGLRLATGLLGVGVIDQEKIKNVELVVELDAELHAVLEQGLQNHVPGAVCCIAGAAHWRFSVIASVATKSTLVDFAIGCPVKREPHVLEVYDRIDCFFGKNFCGVLVDEVVATLNGVEGVPLPAVFFDIRQCGGHATLRCARVRAGGVELRDHSSLGVRASLNRSTHAGASGADNHHVVLVVMGCDVGGGGGWCGGCHLSYFTDAQNEGNNSAGDPAGHGSNA